MYKVVLNLYVCVNCVYTTTHQQQPKTTTLKIQSHNLGESHSDLQQAEYVCRLQTCGYSVAISKRFYKLKWHIISL